MFKHAQRNDFVKRFVNITIILQANFNGKFLAALLCQLLLLFRDGESNNFHIVIFGGILGKASPPAPNVQHTLSGREFGFLADHIQRSEERRVGKECRQRWWAAPRKKKKTR